MHYLRGESTYLDSRSSGAGLVAARLPFDCCGWVLSSSDGYPAAQQQSDRDCRRKRSCTSHSRTRKSCRAMWPELPRRRDGVRVGVAESSAVKKSPVAPPAGNTAVTGGPSNCAMRATVIPPPPGSCRAGPHNISSVVIVSMLVVISSAGFIVNVAIALLDVVDSAAMAMMFSFRCRTHAGRL